MTTKIKRHPVKGGATGVRRQLSSKLYTKHVRLVMNDGTTCDRELCVYSYEHSLGSQRLCNFHYRQIIDPIRLKVARRKHELLPDTPLGVARFVSPHADFPLRFRHDRIGYCVCTFNECSATWVGVEGEPCSWCIRRAVREQK
jgi:hypothetical protein